MTTILAIDDDKNTLSTITEAYVPALNPAPLLDDNGGLSGGLMNILKERKHQ